jgi:phosphonatase-like hydrolase
VNRVLPIHIWEEQFDNIYAMIRMVVFDMAGTTVDEDNVVYKTLQKSINEKGFSFSLYQVMEQGAGREKLQAVRSILKAYTQIEDKDISDEIYQRFIVLLRDAYKNLPVLPQPGAIELFQYLKSENILVVLNTGYNNETALNLVEKLDWEKGKEFDELITASDVESNRPDPDMIWLAMKKFGIENAGEVVKIGDSIVDIEEGRNAGCRFCIGITTGAHNFSQLQTANPDYIINNLLELIPILKSFNC